MTSIYSTFADHNETTIIRRARDARAAGDGMPWGEMEHTPTSAAREMGAIILYTMPDSSVVCELSDRLYMVCDVDGPWAVEVATQEDLAQ